MVFLNKSKNKWKENLSVMKMYCDFEQEKIFDKNICDVFGENVSISIYERWFVKFKWDFNLKDKLSYVRFSDNDCDNAF